MQVYQSVLKTLTFPVGISTERWLSAVYKLVTHNYANTGLTWTQHKIRVITLCQWGSSQVVTYKMCTSQFSHKTKHLVEWHLFNRIWFVWPCSFLYSNKQLFSGNFSVFLNLDPLFMYFGKQNILNCTSRSRELPAATRLQWLQCNPFGKLRLSKLRPLKVFDFAADMLRLLFYTPDYIAETISTEIEVVEVLRSIIFFGSSRSLDQGECSLFLPRLDGQNPHNIQPWLNKIHSCWHFLLIYIRLRSPTVTHVSTVIFLEQLTSRKTSD